MYENMYAFIYRYIDIAVWTNDILFLLKKLYNLGVIQL